MSAEKPLWLISGFLGSGKTTVLNRLLSQFAPARVGVIVNDFGSLAVDVHLLEAGAAVQMIELNGGQIFCSCISGSFVDRLVEITNTSAEAILVETSGMAKPGAMGPILTETQSRTGGAFRYAGMVTVVDAPRFDTLRTVVNAVEEQVVNADLLVLNKCDLVTAEELDRLGKTLGELNPKARILAVTQGSVEKETLPEGPTAEPGRKGPGGESYRGWRGKKPITRSWTPQAQITAEELEEEVARRAQSALRIKGFAPTAAGPVFVSAVGSQVTLQYVDEIPGEVGLTEFYPADYEAETSTDNGRALDIAAEAGDSCESK